MTSTEPGAPAGAPTGSPGRGRRVRRAVIAVLALFVVLVVAINVVNRGSGTAPDAAGTDASPGADASKAPAPREVPPPPAGLASPGSWVESTVDADGDVEVEQWIRSAVPVTRLQLTTADPDALPGTVESSQVIASSFDGRRLAARGDVGTRTLDVELRRPATDIYLSYSIAGDTLSGETSTVAGRSTVRVTAMDVAFEGEDGPTTRVVRGPGTVLNAACLDPAAGYDAPPEPCGGPVDDGWQIELDAASRHDRVLAQLEAAPAS